ncbi:MAG: calcium-binding protein [Pirellulaceae bacterium]|nr:calcium-binding protein [Pirellulaceae bacterium]
MDTVICLAASADKSQNFHQAVVSKFAGVTEKQLGNVQLGRLFWTTYSWNMQEIFWTLLPHSKNEFMKPACTFLTAFLFVLAWMQGRGELYAECSNEMGVQAGSVVPIYILAGQSNANLSGMDRIIVNAINESGNAAEFVKVAVNGTSLNADPNRLDWDPNTGELFVDLETAITNAIENVVAQGHTPTLAILWVQGEGYKDPLIPYAVKLKQLITQLQVDFAAYPLDFVISLSPSNPLTLAAQLSVISEKPEVLYVEALNAGYWDEGVHLDRPTREGIAQDFLALVPRPVQIEQGYTRLEPTWGIEYWGDHDLVAGFAYTDFSHEYVGTVTQIVNSFSGDDQIVTGAGQDTIFTGGNDDIVFAGDDADYISGEAHEDELHGEGGNDLILGGLGADVIFGGDGNDNMRGGNQNDLIYGDAGADILQGDPGDDLLDGGEGEDTASYISADSAVVVGLYLAGPQVTGGTGTDTLVNIENLTGGAFADTLRGSQGPNRLIGGKGNDYLYGYGGDDRIEGGEGNDYINAGPGRDQIFGGAGADRFIFATGQFAGSNLNTADWIRDFSAADSDKIDLRLVDGDTSIPGMQKLNFIGKNAFSNLAGELRFQAIGVNAMVYGDTSGDGIADFAIRLDSVSALSVSEFLLH